MTYDDLKRSVECAKRFLDTANEVEWCFLKYPEQTWYNAPQFAVKSATCKRASMDLTRALVKVR